MLNGIKAIHCIGVGGAGMCPLAQVLASRGYRVSGSDRERSAATQQLQRLGIAVQHGHEPSLVTQAQLVVYSSAVKPDNAERAWAEAHGVPQVRRAEMLGEIMQGSCAVCVAGTHGKTTTTALTGHLLKAAGRDPTVFGGGEVAQWGGYAIVGGSDLLVAEADEFDRSFLAMHPTVAVITNIEADHLDCYADLSDIKSAFVQFAAKVPANGAVVACSDDAGVSDVLPRISAPVVTYGLGAGARVRGARGSVRDGRQVLSVTRDGAVLGEVELRLPGEHNLRNALAAITAAMQVGAAFDAIGPAVGSFAGVRRRLEVAGTAGGVTVIDDYAHHPTEVAASLAALRTMGYRRLLACFQPHLYSRTRDFAPQFAASLAAADEVLVMDIYAAREKPIAGVHARAIVESPALAAHRSARHVAGRDELVSAALRSARPGDAVVLMGAGDIWKAAEPLLKGLAP